MKLAFGYLLLGLICCFVPLFNIVGYESAALFAVIGGFASVALGHRFWTERCPTSFQTLDSPWVRSLQLLAWHLLLLSGPLALLTLNGLRVENCDPATGLLFWLVLVVPSLLIGQTVALLSVGGFRTRGVRILVSVAAVIGSIAWFLAHLALQPPITGFQWFLGYFSGSIYDEALSVPSSLVWYRVMCLLGVATVVSAFDARWRFRTGRPHALMAVVAVFAFVGCAWMFTNRVDHGIDIDRAHIQKQLGGRVETEHFIIYFPANAQFRKEIEHLKDDHEFRYHEMVEFFGLDPVKDGGDKLESYVYPNREVKGQLMGGRRTLVAKLWLGEMHIMWRKPGDHLLAHELSHLFTPSFGTGPLRLSTRYLVGINMGLVEGIATAADWPARNMTPHEASAALRALDRAPDIRRLLSASGFWTASSGRAYTLVGSFIRYLRDTYGIEKIRAAYGHGEFEKAYGKSVDELVSEWEAFIDTVELSERQKAQARFVYDKPSIFQKKCARVIGEWRREAYLALDASDVNQAEALFQKILGYDDNPRYQLEYAQFLLKVQRFDEAAATAQKVIDADLGPSFEAQGRQLLGDALWVKGSLKNADGEYSRCLELGVPLDTHRLVTVKRGTLRSTSGPTAELGLDYLLREPDSQVALFYPTDWVRRNPDNPLANYLIGRRLWGANEFTRALPFLDAARGRMGDEILEYETELMYGQALYWLGRDEAIEVFEQLSKAKSSPYAQAGEEWANRTRWRSGRNTVEAR